MCLDACVRTVYNTHMAKTPFRSMRESTGLSLREVSRRTGINPGRLSIIERGIEPTEYESDAIKAVLVPLLIKPQAQS